MLRELVSTETDLLFNRVANCCKGRRQLLPRSDRKCVAAARIQQFAGDFGESLRDDFKAFLGPRSRSPEQQEGSHPQRRSTLLRSQERLYIYIYVYIYIHV